MEYNIYFDVFSFISDLVIMAFFVLNFFFSVSMNY